MRGYAERAIDVPGTRNLECKVAEITQHLTVRNRLRMILGNSLSNRLPRPLEVAMRITWRSILTVLLTVVIPIFVVGETPGTQSPSSGATSTKHDAVIKGTVISANGKHLKKAHVTLVNLSTEEKTETQTDKSGRFQFSELFSGQYRLEVKTERGETASDEVSLEGGKTVVRKLVAKRQG